MKCTLVCVNGNTETVSVQERVHVCDVLKTVSLRSLTCHKTVGVASCLANIFSKTTQDLPHLSVNLTPRLGLNVLWLEVSDLVGSLGQDSNIVQRCPGGRNWRK